MIKYYFEHYCPLSLMYLITIVIVIVCLYIFIKRMKIRKQKEQNALTNITIGMKKEQVDNLLGLGILDKTTKTYISYKYMEEQKIGNTSYSMNWNFKGGRTYYHAKRSYLLIKYSKDTLEVIEIINHF